MALESQGVSIFISTATTVHATSQQIGEVTDFTGPGGAAAIIDVTHLNSLAKEKLVGLADEGQLSMSLNYVSTDTGQLALQADRAARTKRAFDIKFTDTATAVAHFKGYVMQFSVSGAVDNKITAQSVIEITGAVTWTTG
jgi:hypothetical protein